MPEHRASTEPGLTPDDVAAPSHAERARSLVEAATTGTLATLTDDGYPYGSYTPDPPEFYAVWTEPAAAGSLLPRSCRRTYFHRQQRAT